MTLQEDEFDEHEPEKEKKSVSCGKVLLNFCTYLLIFTFTVAIVGYSLYLYKQIGTPKSTSYSIENRNKLVLDPRNPDQSLHMTVIQNIS